MFCYVLLFLLVFSLDESLVYSATRSSLSIELFILMRSCTFLCLKYVFVSLSSVQITHLYEHTLHFQDS